MASKMSRPPNQPADWDSRALLTNLTFLQQRIHQVREMVESIAARECELSARPYELAAVKQLVTTDMTTIIIQMISTTGSLRSSLLVADPTIARLSSVIGSSANAGLGISDCGEGVEVEPTPSKDHDTKHSEDIVEAENLAPGSYEVLQLEKDEILVPHTHFCSICNKGFKRDANLRMHMRGHGDEYKTPAALAKPIKNVGSERTSIKRYSCPFVGCKRNKEHKNFRPLKTILCVKNHYKRTHCDKSYTCSRCNSKKFSVLADLKTHEKHCGRDRWQCSCGTTFSRKDKMFGHISLFQGHTPVTPLDEDKGARIPEMISAIESTVYNNGFIGNPMDDNNVLGIEGVDDINGCFSPMNFDECSFGTMSFDMEEIAFSFLPPNDANRIGVAHETIENIHGASKGMTVQEARQILGTSERVVKP